LLRGQSDDDADDDHDDGDTRLRLSLWRHRHGGTNPAATAAITVSAITVSAQQRRRRGDVRRMRPGAVGGIRRRRVAVQVRARSLAVALLATSGVRRHRKPRDVRDRKPRDVRVDDGDYGIVSARRVAATFRRRTGRRASRDRDVTTCVT